jgi:hypothetical protein
MNMHHTKGRNVAHRRLISSISLATIGIAPIQNSESGSLPRPSRCGAKKRGHYMNMALVAAANRVGAHPCAHGPHASA